MKSSIFREKKMILLTYHHLFLKVDSKKPQRHRTKEQRSAPAAKKTFSKDRTQFFFNPRKLKHSKNVLGKKIDTLLTNTFVIGFHLGYYIIVHKTELICDTRQKSQGILDTRK